MHAQLTPPAVKREEYLLLRRCIATAGAYPSTPAGRQRVLGSDDLAHTLSANGAPIEVRVVLELSPITLSGYHWTSTLNAVRNQVPPLLPADWIKRSNRAPGPPTILQSGTPWTADIHHRRAGTDLPDTRQAARVI